MSQIGIDLLRSLISYNPETGEMLWLARPASMFDDGKQSAERSQAVWNGRFAGKPALGSPDRRGYLTGRLFYAAVKAHRVAWALHHGEWPAGDIDHINGIVSDNRISNLRDVPHIENGRNLSRSKANRSGITGVHQTPSGKWSAVIDVNGRRRRLGTYLTKGEAAEARRAGEREHGFHANHGRAI